MLLAHRVEHCHARTEERAEGGWIDVGRNGDGRFGSKNTILGICRLISTVRQEESHIREVCVQPPSRRTPLTVAFSHIWNNPRLQALQIPAGAISRGKSSPGSQGNTIMPAMPRSANSIAYLPFLLTRRDSNHCPDYLVARNNGTAPHRESVGTKAETVRGNDILGTSVNIILDHCVGVTNP